MAHEKDLLFSEEAVRTDCAWFSPAFLYSREQASCPTDHRQLLEPSGSRDSPLVLEDAGLDWRHPGDADTVGGEMFQAPRVSQSGPSSFHCRNQFGLLKAAGELGSAWQVLAAWLSPTLLCAELINLYPLCFASVQIKSWQTASTWKGLEHL